MGQGGGVASHNALVDLLGGVDDHHTSPVRLILERPRALAPPPDPAAAHVFNNPHRLRVTKLRGARQRWAASVVASSFVFGLGGKLSGPDAPLQVQQRVLHLSERGREAGRETGRRVRRPSCLLRSSTTDQSVQNTDQI